MILIISGIFLGGLYIDYFKNAYIIYGLQVLSGNWGGSQPAGVDQYSYVVGSIFAVILNTVTIGAIVKGAVELTIIRRERMNIKNAFNVRDQLAFKKIRMTLMPLTENLPEDQVSQLEDKLWNCFIDADREWASFAERTLPGVKLG